MLNSTRQIASMDDRTAIQILFYGSCRFLLGKKIMSPLRAYGYLGGSSGTFSLAKRQNIPSSRVIYILNRWHYHLYDTKIFRLCQIKNSINPCYY